MRKLVAIGAGIGAIIGLMALSQGCVGRSEHSRIAERLLPDGGEQLSTSAVFYREEKVLQWGFQTPGDVAAWKLENVGSDFEARAEGLYLRSKSPDPWLSRETELDAERVHAIRIEHSGLTTGAFVRIYWAAPGEPFDEQRALSADIPDPTGSLIPTFTLPVGHHELWQGTIGRIRIDPTSQADRRVMLYSVTAIGYEPTDEALGRVLSRSWRVDLTGDVRSAVLTPPGHPYEAEVDVPRDATLRFSLGLTPDIKIPVRYRVHAATDGRPFDTQWVGTMRPCKPRSGCAWLDQSLDLSPFAGERITLRFDTQVDEPLDLFDGMPAWAGLQVVTRARANSPPNVIMIVLDTLRADRLSLYGYHRRTSPNIDTWAREHGITFANTVAPAPWTLPSHVSIFTGLDTLSHGVNTGDPTPPALVMLAETLRDNGYATVAVTAGGYLATEYALMQGFDRIDYFHDPRIWPRESGNDLDHGMATTLSWLESDSARPFFLLLHTYETHGPYRAREPYFSQLRDEPFDGEPPLITTAPIEPKKSEGFVFRSEIVERFLGEVLTYDPISPERVPLVQDLYDSSVARADAEVGRLLTRLNELGLDRETIVVLLSDHGEVLGEGGWGGHFGLRECELMVPLVIALPDRRFAGTTVTEQVRLIDVAPTLLDVIGIEPEASMDGSSLIPLAKGDVESFPTEAWSYASSSNHGISLRVENQRKTTLNNSPWPPAKGARELFLLDGNEAGEPAPVTDNAITKTMARRISERFKADTSGLRVRFVNDQPVPMECLLMGSLVKPLRIKALAGPPGGFRWNLQRLEVTVPPGEDMTTHIEGNLFGTLLVVAQFPTYPKPRNKTRHEIDLGQLTEPWQVMLTDTGWSEDSEAPFDGGTGVRAWVAGDPSLVAQGGVDVGDDVRAQLEALGYVTK